MGFRDRFLGGPESYGELSPTRTVGQDNDELLFQLDKAIQQLSERLLAAAANVAAAGAQNAAWVGELEWVVHSPERMGLGLSLRGNRQKDLHGRLRQVAGYLGGPWVELRFALERLTEEGDRAFHSANLVMEDAAEPLREGIEFFETARYTDACCPLGTVLEIHPAHFFGNMYMGFCQAMLEKHALALAHLEMAFKGAPYGGATAMAACLMARVCRAQGEMSRALEYAAKAADAAPCAPEWWRELAALQLEAGRSGPALGSVRRALQLDPLYWVAMAADPDLARYQSAILSYLPELRKEQSAAYARERTRVQSLLAQAPALEAESAAEKTQRRFLEIDSQWQQENFFVKQKALSSLAELTGVFQQVLDAGVGRILAHVRGRLEQLAMERSAKLSEASENLDALRRRLNQVQLGYSPWHLGCLGYFVLWSAFAGGLLILDFRSMTETGTGQYVAVALLLFAWVFPLAVFSLINVVRRWELVMKPSRMLHKRIAREESLYEKQRQMIEQCYEEPRLQYESRIREAEAIRAALVESAGAAPEPVAGEAMR